ncbi:hypothetical protein J6590_024222 [Homalodisca vitripennis]|nr:hypothetical protein J6590_024222 [Homalodisca vitripennis]
MKERENEVCPNLASDPLNPLLVTTRLLEPRLRPNLTDIDSRCQVCHRVRLQTMHKARGKLELNSTFTLNQPLPSLLRYV